MIVLHNLTEVLVNIKITTGVQEVVQVDTGRAPEAFWNDKQ